MKTRGVNLNFKTRQKKSLSVLAYHVCNWMQDNPIFSSDNIKDVCASHGFCERRSFDVINILDAFGMIRNLHRERSYVWEGYPGFVKRVEHFKRLNKFVHTSRKYLARSKYTLEVTAQACLYVMTILNVAPRYQDIVTALRRINYYGYSKRSIYDVLNVLKCFPELRK